VVVGFELRSSCLLGECLPLQLCLQPILIIFYLAVSGLLSFTEKREYEWELFKRNSLTFSIFMSFQLTFDVSKNKGYKRISVEDGFTARSYVPMR
jgi:hypothetical protein